jgi:hypothetical protein
MNRLESYSKRLMWFIPLLFTAFVTGCGGGDNGKDPILGAGGVTFAAPPGAIAPGVACTTAAPGAPTVTVTDPTNSNQFVTTSTAGVANSGKLITATFSLPMDSGQLNQTSFTLGQVGGAVVPAASVSYNTSTRVATLTTSSALSPNTSYTAVILGTVTSGGISMGCSNAWTFKTVTPAATGLAPVNLGLASTFGISATAGLATAGGSSTINGDVLLLNPTPVCNATTVPATGLIGSCAAVGFPPTVNGTVISPLYNPAGNLATIAADLNTGFLSITPPAGPPAVGTLGGGTTILAPTTLGTGSTGQSTFTPGVYVSGTSIGITGDLTLDAQGNPDAVFVFQSGSTVGTAAGAVSPGVHTRILLANGAKASNVWWQAASSATIGTFSEFQGNIMAAVSITLNQGATSCGRMMAGAWVGGGGAITLDRSVVSVPGNVNAPASCQ